MAENAIMSEEQWAEEVRSAKSAAKGLGMLIIGWLGLVGFGLVVGVILYAVYARV